MLKARKKVDADECLVDKQQAGKTQSYKEHEALKVQHSWKLVQFCKPRDGPECGQHGEDGEEMENDLYLLQEIGLDKKKHVAEQHDHRDAWEHRYKNGPGEEIAGEGARADTEQGCQAVGEEGKRYESDANGVLKLFKPLHEVAYSHGFLLLGQPRNGFFSYRFLIALMLNPCTLPCRSQFYQARDDVWHAHDS